MFFKMAVLKQVKGQYTYICLCIYIYIYLSLYTIVSIHHIQPGSSMQCQILSPNYEAIQGHALREKAIVCTPASDISSSTGSYCIRRAAVTTSAKASAPDADAGSMSDMRASLAATKL